MPSPERRGRDALKFPFRRMRRCPEWPRRLISLCLLLSYLAFQFPFPLPPGISISGLTTQVPSQYPCQDRGCGCRSAEQCWQRCCCFSSAEKVAWAEKRGVTPPDFVIDDALEERRVESAVARSCCASRSDPAESCAKDDQSDLGSTPDGQLRGDEPPAGFILIRQRRCQGFEPDEVRLIPAVPERRQVVACLDDRGRWERPRSQRVPMFVSEPPEPPPRLMMVFLKPERAMSGPSAV